MSVHYIYILSNPAMPGLLKIGFTNRDVKERVRELSVHTGVPKPFEIEYYYLTRDVEEVEGKAHIHFSSCRAPGKEFFSVPVLEAVTVIDSLVKTVESDRFSKVTVQVTEQITVRPVRPREEKPFDLARFRQWQEKRWNSKKTI